MKEVKNERLEIRLTAAEKQQIKEYAEQHNMSTSEFIRWACGRVFEKSIGKFTNSK